MTKWTLIILFALFAAAVLRPGHAEERPSSSIVDVRIDAPHAVIAGSAGDEWGPTWGPDDHLYTGNDDGASFGGVPFNAVGFGRLEGASPQSLKGFTVSGMEDFREPTRRGPEGAAWKPIETVMIGTARYRLNSCPTSPGATCLFTQQQGGNEWQQAGVLFPAGPGHFSFAERSEAMERLDAGNEFRNVDVYVYAAAYARTANGEDLYQVARVRRDKLASGALEDWTYQNDWDFVADPAKAAPYANVVSFLGADRANWKVMNAYSVDGTLYMFVTRCLYPMLSGDPHGRHIFRSSSVIKSADGGKTWTRSAAENYARPMFPGQRFGAPYFVWYGKDGAATADNADRYIYAVSNNGHFDGGDDLVIGRVARDRISNLRASDWSFYRDGDGMSDAAWAPRLDDAKPILTRPLRLGMAGITYLPALGRYVLSGWNYVHSSFGNGIQNKDLSTTLDFYEAPAPWGPWTPVKSIKTGELGWYAPTLGQKFQVVADGGRAVQAQLYVTGINVKKDPLLIDFSRYRMTYMPVTFSTVPLKHRDPNYAGGK